MTTETDQNYLKEIYALENDHGHATTSMIAERLGYSPATVTGQLKKLSGRDLVLYSPYQGATLTESGRAAALEIIRHHRLLETYLARALKVPWDRVHGEAEKLEHAISEYLEERIDTLLDHPDVDPHGSPIPSREGVMRSNGSLRLADLPVGTHAKIVEVNDRDPALLARLEELRLHPGARVEIIAIEPVDGLITIRISGALETLGQTSASQLIVRRIRT